LPHLFPQLRFLADEGEKVVKAEQWLTDFLRRMLNIIPIIATYSRPLLEILPKVEKKYY
jgi:hypothetical protein